MTFTVGSFVETPQGTPGIVVKTDPQGVCKVYELTSSVVWWYPSTDLQPRDMKDVSDSRHTFRDLYQHRLVLTAALCRQFVAVPVFAGAAHAVRSWQHAAEDDEPMFEGMFIVVIMLPGIGQVRYHYPAEHWELFDSCETVERAPAYDGAPPGASLARLQQWIAGVAGMPVEVSGS